MSSCLGSGYSLRAWQRFLVACSAIYEAKAESSFKKEVVPFFEKYCIRCHGPEKARVRSRSTPWTEICPRDVSLERWEDVLEMLESGEMLPEDEEQPSETKRMFIADWINSGLHDYAKKASEVEVATTTRRLTNFEYQNTMRDLLGFELELPRTCRLIRTNPIISTTPRK